MIKKGLFYLLLLVFAVTLTGCSSSNTYNTDSNYTDTSNEQYDNNEETADDPEYFHGYECTDDCSGHDAGYQWAEDEGIDDPDDCNGNSNSFIEGCQAYAEENY